MDVKVDWDSFYLLQALDWSSRSPDESTKCGCVLVAEDNTPISAGYNGLLRGVSEEDYHTYELWQFLTIRPDKYDFFPHSEQNAIYNATRQGKSTLGCTAYVTGEPCLPCTHALFQVGCTRLAYSLFNRPKMLDNKDYQDKFERVKLLIDGKMEIEQIPLSSIDLKGRLWANSVLEEKLKETGV